MVSLSPIELMNVILGNQKEILMEFQKSFLNVFKEICQGWFSAFVIIHLKENNAKSAKIKT